jgi:hypothetical protein
MKSRRFTAQYLPCFRTKGIAHLGTAALRDFKWPTTAVGQKAPKAFGALVGRFPQYLKSGRCRIPSSGSGRGVCQPRAPSSVKRVNRVNSIFSGCAAGGPSRGCPKVENARRFLTLR